MKHVILAVMVAVGLVAAPVDAAKPTPVGTIVLNEPGPFALDDTVSFTTSWSGLRGGQYPLVYVQCVDAAGVTLYGQLDYPDTVFLLGGGWSPWRDTPTVDAVCHAELLAYGGKDRGYDTIVLLAETAPFAAAGA